MEGMFMRTGFLTLALIIAVFASATPAVLVNAQQPRNQSQSQGGLSQEKKRELSKMGPEDLFPGSGEDPRRGAVQGYQNGRRRGTPTPTPSAASQRQEVTPAAT